MNDPGPAPPLARVLSPDGRLLFGTRFLRLFAYGFLSVVLALYLAETGLSPFLIGLIFTLTLAGDALISLLITAVADRAGRKRMLLLGSALMLGAGAVFALTDNVVLLIAAGIVGVISPSGNEIGPFLSIEQASLSQLLPARSRTRAFAWYNLAGSAATALGALTAGGLSQVLHNAGLSLLASYRAVVFGYALFGALLFAAFCLLSPRIEAVVLPQAQTRPLSIGLHRSRRIVLALSSLFALDAFAGGFIIQSFIAYWFHLTFRLAPAVLGSIFFGANILAGASALLAARLAARLGLIRTMVFTHIPSNLLLMLVPLMPSLAPAIAVLLLRFSISQMDVPARQAYTMALVDADERSAASGVTGVARSVGAAISPSLTGALIGAGLFAAPFFIAGGLKIVYDLILYFTFRSRRPTEEKSE